MTFPNKSTPPPRTPRVDSAESEQREFLTALHDLAISTQSTINIEKSFDRILITLARVVPYQMANILLFESGVARVVRSRNVDYPGSKNTTSAETVLVEQTPQLAQVIATGQAIVLSQVREQPTAMDYVGPAWVQSHITAPVLIGEQIVGFVSVDGATPAQLNARHAGYLQAFADQVALAIENARLIAESQHRIRELSSLNRIQTSINSTLELDWVLRLTMQEVQDLFGVEECSLMLLDDQTNELSFQVTLGPLASKQFRLSVNRGIAGWVTRTGNPAIVNDVHSDPRWEPHPDLITGFKTRSILALPLKSRNKVVGVIELLNKIEGLFDDSDLRLLTSVSNLVAGAIENARLFGELNKAYQDMAQTQAQVLESRNTLRTLFDGIEDRIWIVNPDLRVQALNRAAASRLELDPRHGVGRYCYEVLDQSDHRCEICPARETLRTHKPGEAIQTLTRENGEPQVLEIRTYPLENPEGSLDGVIEIVQDVTEKRKMESMIVQSAKLSAVGELAAGVAHEINNPLTAVYGNAQMLVHSLEPGDQRFEMAQLIERASLRASKVVRNLLDFARQEDYQFEPTDVAMTIEDSLALILHQLHRSTITVTTDAEKNLPLVQASASHLQTVWTNLLINARDAIGEQQNGHIHITIRAKDDVIQTSFADDGPGITAKDLLHIFDPFFTTKPQGRGTGLGLYVSQMIVAHHGGTMQVSSQPGQGATFIVNLPINPPPTADPSLLANFGR